MSKSIELSAAILSVLISAVAVYVSYIAVEAANAAAAKGIEIAEKTRRDTEAHNQLSLTPILRFSYQLSGGKSNGFNFSVTNYGPGPAIIKEVQIIYRDRQSNGDVASLNQLISGLNLQMYSLSLNRDQVIEPSKTNILFKSITPDANCALDKARKDFFENTKFKIVYESLYKIRNEEILIYKSPNKFNCK